MKKKCIYCDQPLRLVKNDFDKRNMHIQCFIEIRELIKYIQQNPSNETNCHLDELQSYLLRM